MVRLQLFRRPSRESQEEWLGEASKSGLNYDDKCGTRKLEVAERGEEENEHTKKLRSEGYRICSRRVKVGEGWKTYRRAKSNLQNWNHVNLLGWTSVLPDTAVKTGSEFCLNARVLGVWIMNPLKTVYIEQKRTKLPVLNMVPVLPLGYTSAKYSFAGGTLKGHLLKGEERYSVSIDKKDKSVHYQVASISKPDHILSRLGYPIVCLLQSNFIRQSARSMARQIKREEDEEASGNSSKQ
jgi:uncharacterized protein (UPF0548 family)